MLSSLRPMVAILAVAVPLTLALDANSAAPASTSTPSSKAFTNPAIVHGPLVATELQAIRGVGRAVLVAKKRQVEAPELAALRQDVQALSRDLDQAMAANLAKPPVLRLGKSQQRFTVTGQTVQMTPPVAHTVVMGEDGHLASREMLSQTLATPTATSSSAGVAPRPSTERRGVASGGADPYARVRQRLALVQTRVTHYTAAAQAQGGEERHIEAQGISAKVMQLHGELQAILDDTSSDSTGRLMALRDRLHQQSFATQSAMPSADQPQAQRIGPTPTLSTLTHHR